MTKHIHSEPLVMIATFFRSFVLASITGLIVGTATSVFLRCLFYASNKTLHASLWVHLLLLPIGGLLTGILIHYGAPDAAGHGTEAVIAAVHEKQGQISAKVGPIKAIATVVTLACGGSAGKEGPCAQIGGALASLFANLIRLSAESRKRLVICGISAGFASVFGTPLAGTIFGIEVLTIGGLMYDVLLPSFISGVTAFEVSKSLGVPYTYYPFPHEIPFTEPLFLKIVLLGMICGLVSWIFIEIFEWSQGVVDKFQQRFHVWKPALPAMGGIILSILILFEPTDYLGLSLSLLNQALHGEHIALFAFFWKIIFVSITLATGFSGGVITPLFVIGATAGNTFGHLLGINPTLAAAVGMMAVIASASNTPLSAIIMGLELFGRFTGVYVLAASITAYIIVGHRSVYPSQIVSISKSLWMHLDLNIPLERETNIHVSYGALRMAKHFAKWRKRQH